LSEGQKFWVAIIWDEVGKTPLGSDSNAPSMSSHLGCINGVTWFPMGNAKPMIRAEYGNDELVNGIEGLQGFNVYKNDQIINTVESDDHEYTVTLESAGTYTFRIDALYLQGVVMGEEFEYTWDGNAADVADNNLPDSWSVATPYPNPFNPSTMLTVEMAAAAELNVQIFNVLGQKVATLASGRYEHGLHKFHFNAGGLTSGIYFIRAEVPGKINSIQKVTFMR
jgi:type IX secretion system substrate protein